METTGARKLLSTPEVERALGRIAQAFRPSAPITSRSLFAGRSGEVRKAVGAICDVGRHVVIFGERGLGKTSLGYILEPTLREMGADRLFARINCDSADDFNSVWHKAFDELGGKLKPNTIHYPDTQAALGDAAGQVIRPNSVRRLMEKIPATVFVFDEFDALSLDTAAIFADLIKSLSDYVVPSTVVLVGVADTITDLVANHHSIDRAIVQVPMPRMNADELREILELASASIDIRFANAVTNRVVELAQGLPHYVHLLGLHCSQSAVRNGRLDVGSSDLRTAYLEATQSASHTLSTEFDIATGSARRDALYKHVLSAAALCKKDGGWFRAADLRKPLEEIAGRHIAIPQYVSHLVGFCSSERGSVLIREGRSKNIRYRFKNPLLEPYVILRGLNTGMIQDTFTKSDS